jgi:glycosyltransferase involved in cell wall biosynthesis
LSTQRGGITLLITTPGWRGSGGMFARIAHGLAEAGLTVQVIAGHRDVVAGFATHGIDATLVLTGDTGRREVAAVRQLLDAHQTRVILADSPRDVRIARYASVLRRRRIIWRYNLHSRRLATDFLQRWLFGGLDHIVHQSEYSRHRLGADSPWLSHIPDSVIPNGIASDALPLAPERGAEFRRRYAIGAGDVLVVTPTSDSPEKQVPVARAAVERLALSRPVTWLVADAGVLPGARGLRVIAAGRLAASDVHDALRAADVVLLPSPVELFGNVTAEAMALGAVVVAADSGATSELVGDAGALFAPGDAAAAADAMTQLLADAGRRAAISALARERIVREYALDSMLARYVALLRQG